MVTPQVIANWFANKRKEMRRKSNDEPLSTTIAQQFVLQSSPINTPSFTSSMNQLVAVANAAAALAHVAANNQQTQQKVFLIFVLKKLQKKL